MRINAIWYPVARWDEAKRFYGELLGLRQSSCNDEMGWAVFDVGSDLPFFLVKRPDRAGVPGGAVATFACEHLDSMVDRLLDVGIDIKETTPPGDAVRIFSVQDPDGNLLELVQITAVA
ncbi:MAG TPA: VOC family protein [Symbiobacteriaceae bacterium]|nr:VOC family protein [Symbiobacteriaceae bacterium]